MGRVQLFKSQPMAEEGWVFNNSSLPKFNIKMMNRTKEPAIHEAVEFDLKLKPYEYSLLDNGVPLYSINAGAQDVTMIEWVFFAGNWYEEKNIVAATTNFLLKNGTKNKTAFAINEHFEFYGAYLNRTCSNETATVTLHCLTKHLPNLLPVVAEILTDAAFEEEEILIYKQNQKQKLEVNLKKCDFVANRLMDKYLFGSQHPYGKFTSANDFDQLQKEELLTFFDQFYRKGRCLIFAAGKLPPDVYHQLNNVFGNIPFNKKPLPEIQHIPEPAIQKKYEIINDAAGVQGAIRLARPFINRHHPDFVKAQVLNNIFGGYFGSRLMSNIREDKGYTYGIHSFFETHLHNNAWVVSTEAGRDVCEATLTETYKEMQRLCNETIDEKELQLVRNHMIGSILSSLDGPFQIIARWKSYILNDLTEAYFYSSLETIKTVTAKELQALANKYFIEHDFYQLTVI